VYSVRWLNVFDRLGPPWGLLARRVGRFLTRR
jgi:hypothetical protein